MEINLIMLLISTCNQEPITSSWYQCISTYTQCTSPPTQMLHAWTHLLHICKTCMCAAIYMCVQ